MITGTVVGFCVPLPASDDGPVTLTVDGADYDLLTRHADTDITCSSGGEGVVTRGSDVLTFLFEAAGPVEVMLWPRETGPVLAAKFCACDPA